MHTDITRRQLIAAAGTVFGAATVLSAESPGAPQPRAPQFKYCLNMSTIRRDDLDLLNKIDIAARAGYDAIEPWINEIDAYLKAGGSLADARKRIEDAGLTVESAIGFAPWIAEDPEQRRQAHEQLRREMDWLVQLGGKRIAAPPSGAGKGVKIDLAAAAERYRAILEIGHSLGIVPQVEVWGFAENLSKLGETAYVAIESRHPDACLLLDVYHLYKGGSDFNGLKLLGGAALHVFHVNDYPADPPRSEITDAYRVYPGDGVAPLDEIFRTLAAAGFHGALSLELFNREYWAQDPLSVAKTGLEKTKAAVAKALGQA